MGFGRTKMQINFSAGLNQEYCDSMHFQPDKQTNEGPTARKPIVRAFTSVRKGILRSRQVKKTLTITKHHVVSSLWISLRYLTTKPTL